MGNVSKERCISAEAKGLDAPYSTSSSSTSCQSERNDGFLSYNDDDGFKKEYNDVQLTHLSDENRDNISISSTDDLLAIVLLTILGLFTRFYRLSYPGAVVFDEYYFSKFMDRMLSRTWFFDIHPPLGKQILAFGSAFLGYKPDTSFVIERIGEKYPSTVKYIIPRILTASFSTLTVPLTYIIGKRMNISKISSALSAFMVGTDFMGIIEGRLILMNSQLLAFSQVSLLCALELWRSMENDPDSFTELFWLTATGLANGAALSIKHTALGTSGLIGVISFFGIIFLPSGPLPLWKCMYAFLTAFSVYAYSFYTMFKQLINTGGKYDTAMGSEFRKTLVGNAAHNPDVKRQSFAKLFAYHNWRMVTGNAGIKKRHSWESTYYQWIINWRGILYYFKSNGDGTTSRIYLFGNPIVLWMVLAVCVMYVLTMVFILRYKRNGSSPRAVLCSFLFAGWLCNLLPYILVDRAAFIYHYIPGLFYGQLLTGAVLDFLPKRIRAATVAASSIAMLAALVYWAPWIYASPLTKTQLTSRRWLPRWN